MNTHRIHQIGTLFVVAGLILTACACPTPAPEETEVPTATEAPVEGAAYKIGFAPGVTGGGSFLGEPERNDRREPQTWQGSRIPQGRERREGSGR